MNDLREFNIKINKDEINMNGWLDAKLFGEVLQLFIKFGFDEIFQGPGSTMGLRKKKENKNGH